MLAQVIKEYGSPEVFQAMELARPSIKKGHVLIRVAATSVNPIDLKIRGGLLQNTMNLELPLILHSDCAGVIEEVGEGVSSFQPGDEVYTTVGLGGALADYTLVDASLVAVKPKSLTFTEAAALPLVALTAWEALVERCKVQPGQKVLIHAGTGGVGHVAIQIAKFLGAQVYTTASTDEKMQLAKMLGADTVINYREQSVEQYVTKHTNGQGFDVVFDTVGGENLDRSFQAVKPRGTVAAIAARSTHDLTPLHNKGLTLHVVFMILAQMSQEGRINHGAILNKLAHLVDEGKIKPLVDSHSFSFEDVSKAHEFLASGQAVGKVTLRNQNFEQ
ncbi:zinc-dependent alcohol dehydrogenase family protein [Bacillus sp. 165]|uniref:zinc-dependent alcohol dehydrogenase family protein n=1 Tax=Bacillus sp. 165 TaxID=1529117 RepID=UPI001ADC5506|nr:zinc-dependent alcohol dehydrogenase family protein [Bacillus sp. 165]MBO9130551.1 zinc-dependent alcohol dehydrogenase family protein [Bacillus sp. 165]